MRVKIIGSSLARNLGQDVMEGSAPFRQNMDLGLGDVVEFRGLGGAGYQRLDRELQYLLDEDDDMVAVIAGGNDVCSEARVETIAAGYSDLVERIHEIYKIQRVVLLAILPRASPRGLTVEEYNKRAKLLNIMLNDFLEVLPFASFWRSQGLWNAKKEVQGANGEGSGLVPLNIFRSDGVHFNREGQKRLYHSLRRAISSNRSQNTHLFKV